VVGFELFTSLMMAFISWQLFSACQRPSSWGSPVASLTADSWLKKKFLKHIERIRWSYCC
jgi:hypothetical protein